MDPRQTARPRLDMRRILSQEERFGDGLAYYHQGNLRFFLVAKVSSFSIVSMSLVQRQPDSSLVLCHIVLQMPACGT